MTKKEMVTVYLGGEKEKDVGRVLPREYGKFFELWELAAVLACLAVLSATVMLI